MEELKERPNVETKGLFLVKRIIILAMRVVYCVSQHTLVLNVSGPCAAM
jgi:hypothetical protein